MPRLRDQSIGVAIGFAIASTLFLMAVLVGLTLFQLQETRVYRRILTDEVSPAIAALDRLDDDIAALSDRLHIALLTGQPPDLTRLAETDRLLVQELIGLDRYPHPDREAEAMAGLRSRVETLRAAMQQLLDRAQRFGADVASREYGGAFQPLVDPAHAAAGRLRELKYERVTPLRQSLIRRGDRLGIYLLTGFFLALVICVFVAHATIEMATVPLRRLVIAARVLEHGEYDRAIDLGAEPGASAEPANEIARLRQSFVRMARGLQEREERLLQQARHLETVNRRLAALQAITDVALTHLHLDQLLQELIQRVVQATDAEAGAILLRDEAGSLRARATCGTTAEAAEASFNDPSGRWAQWLSADAEPMLAPQSGEEGPASKAPPGASRLASMLVLPLIAGDQAIGLAHLDGTQPDQFGEEAVALMRVFAERAALAIERARAFAELENWNQILARRLAEQQEKLVQTERLASLGLIGGSIAHELRNPLGVITNAVFFLRQRLRGGDEKLLRHAQILEREVAHAVRIIDNLVQFSHETEPFSYPVALRPVVEETLKRIEVPASVALEVDLPEDLPRVQADEHRLVQVLENLLRNSIQAIAEQGTIRLQASPAGESVTISVRDTGPGIPPEYRARLFEPLFSTKVKGMGLGLALSKKMVEAWRGRIEAECPPEGGTIFRVTLPAAPPAAGPSLSQLAPSVTRNA